MTQQIFSTVTIDDLKGIIEQAVEQSFAKLNSAQPIADSEELVTRKQAANLLGISLPTLHDYTKRGLIPAYRIGTRIRYKQGELLECLRKVQAKKFHA
jgi:excisionase family DNA binding protein